jgi:hypothetical protein
LNKHETDFKGRAVSGTGPKRVQKSLGKQFRLIKLNKHETDFKGRAVSGTGPKPGQKSLGKLRVLGVALTNA